MPVGANLKLRLWCPGCWRGRLVGLLCSLEMEILLRSWQELLCKRYFIINHYFIISNLRSRLRFQPLENYHNVYSFAYAKIFAVILFFFFLMWTIFKVFIQFVTILFLFCVWFFGHEACGILASQTGIEPRPPTL